LLSELPTLAAASAPGRQGWRAGGMRGVWEELSCLQLRFLRKGSFSAFLVLEGSFAYTVFCGWLVWGFLLGWFVVFWFVCLFVWGFFLAAVHNTAD